MHDHHHDHSHAPKTYGKAFGFGIALNSAFIIGEIIFGFKANSLALLADAGHNASDVLSLILAWAATWLARRKSTANFTYGFKNTTILASLINAMLLLFVTGGICLEAAFRLFNPQPVQGSIVMIIAFIGFLINGGTALLFMRDRTHDLNIKSTFLHMAADAAVSLGVVISGFIVLKTSANWLDPVVSITVAILIIIATWSLLKESIKLTLSGVPGQIDFGKVKDFLQNHPHVTAIHDLHIWAMSTTETALSAHLQVADLQPDNQFLKGLATELKHHYQIGHTTIQLELAGAQENCASGIDC